MAGNPRESCDYCGSDGLVSWNLWRHMRTEASRSLVVRDFAAWGIGFSDDTV